MVQNTLCTEKQVHPSNIHSIEYLQVVKKCTTSTGGENLEKAYNRWFFSRLPGCRPQFETIYYTLAFGDANLYKLGALNPLVHCGSKNSQRKYFTPVGGVFKKVTTCLRLEHLPSINYCFLHIRKRCFIAKVVLLSALSTMLDEASQITSLNIRRFA